MTALAVALPALPALPAYAPDADATDAKIVAMWLHGRSKHTVRAYRRAIDLLDAFLGRKPLRLLTLSDLQRFADSLTGAASSRGQTLAAVKSLLSFAVKLGALVRNVGVLVKKPAARDGLADRILDESDVQKMLALTTGRDHALVRLAYASALRVSELVGLRWSDLANADDGGLFLTVCGKGGKTRTVRVSAATAKTVRALRGDAPASAHVFAGRNGGLDPSQAWRIVRAAAVRAGLEKPVSPHFMRHAHASHAIDRGELVTTVRDTLGHSSIAVTDRYAHARPGQSSSRLLAV
jgi:integrase/recombinase XerD